MILRKKILVEKKYLFLCLFLLLFFALYPILLGYYGGDFFYHAAAISEFKINLFHPTHPFYGTADGSPHLSPYHFILGAIARILNCDVILLFKWIGLFNFILLASGIYIFCITYFKNHSIPFYALLFIIFLWGYNPWGYSNFFHILSLGLLLPYHSTVTIGLSFFCFAFVIRMMNKFRWYYLMVIPILVAFISLSQPVNATFVSLGVFSFIIFSDNYKLPIKILLLVIIAFLSFLYIISWPFYHFFDLFLQLENVQREMNTGHFYNIWSILRGTFPLLVMLIISFVFIKKHLKIYPSLFFFVFLLIIIYSIGSPFNINYIGRLISPIIILFQIILAAYLVHLKNFDLSRYKVLKWCILPIFIFQFGQASYKLVNFSRVITLPHDFLSSTLSEINHNDVLMSDMETNYFIPAFNGKVVAQIFGEAFVKDNLERKENVELFYRLKTSNEIRMKILKKYKVKYILINENNMLSTFFHPIPIIEKPVCDSLFTIGTMMSTKDRFILLKVKY
jgi:hypothetical protein